MTLTAKQAWTYAGCLVLIGALLGSYVGCKAGAITTVLPGIATIVHDTLPGTNTNTTTTVTLRGGEQFFYDTTIVTKFVALHDTIIRQPQSAPPKLPIFGDVVASIPITNSIPAFTSTANPQGYFGVKLQHDFLGGTWGGGLDLRAHVAGKFYVVADAGLFAKQLQANAGVEYRVWDIY